MRPTLQGRSFRWMAGRRCYRDMEGMVMERDIIREDMEDIFNRDIPWELLRHKTVFLSGAYGMLASYLVFFLMYLNEEKGIPVNVVAQGRSEKKARERFERFWDHSRFRFTDVDILRPLHETAPVDYVIHAAGLASPQYYATAPVEVIEGHALGAYHLLNLAREHKASGFLYFSSGEIYGKVKEPGRITETTMGEMDPFNIQSCYAESKRLGETLCAAFYREYALQAKIARIGHTYGPTMDVEHDPRVFASFMKCILQEEDIILHSDGSAKRAFCYLADAAAAYFLILLKGRPAEAYNVSNNQEFLSILELAKKMASIPPHEVAISFRKRERQDTYLENNVNKDNRILEDKLRKLGWETHFDVREGFGRVYTYFIQEKQKRKQGMIT